MIPKQKSLPRRPIEVPLNEHEEHLFRNLEVIVEECLETDDFGVRRSVTAGGEKEWGENKQEKNA